MRTITNPRQRPGRSCLKKQRLNKIKANCSKRNLMDREPSVIRFATRKKLKRIPPLNTFTLAEIEATWYSRTEVDTITHEADALVLKAEDSPEGTSVLDFDGESIRGLERKTQDGHHEAFLARVRVYQAVLDEQDAQRSVSDKLQDGSRIAALSLAASDSSRLAAIERAKRDEADIQVYLHHCSRTATQSKKKCDPEPELELEDVFQQMAPIKQRNPSVAAFISKRNSMNSLKGNGKSDASWITRGTGCTSTTSFESLDMSMEDLNDASFRSQTSTGSSSSSNSAGGKDKLAAFANKALQAAAASNSRRRSSTFQRASKAPVKQQGFGRKNTYTGSIRAEAATTADAATAQPMGRKNTYTGSIRAEPVAVEQEAKPAAGNAGWTSQPNAKPQTKTYITTSNKKTPTRAKPAWMTKKETTEVTPAPAAEASTPAAPAATPKTTPRMRRDSCYARTGGMSAMAAAAVAVQQSEEPKAQLTTVKSSPALMKAPASPPTKTTNPKMRRDSCYTRTGAVSSMAAVAALAQASLEDDSNSDATPPPEPVMPAPTKKAAAAPKKVTKRDSCFARTGAVSSMSAIAAMVKADLDEDNSIGKNSSDASDPEEEQAPVRKPLQKVKSVPAMAPSTKKVVGRQRRDSCMARSSSVASMPATAAAKSRAATPERQRRAATPERQRRSASRSRAATPEPAKAEPAPKNATESAPVSPRTAKRNGYRRGSSFKRARELEAKAQVIPTPAQTALEAPEILVPKAKLVKVSSRKSLSGSSRGSGSTRRGVVSVSSRKSLSAMDEQPKNKTVVVPQRRATAPAAPASPKRPTQAAVSKAAPASPASPKKPVPYKNVPAAPASPSTSTGSSSKSSSKSSGLSPKIKRSSAAARRQRPSIFAIAPPSLDKDEDNKPTPTPKASTNAGRRRASMSAVEPTVIAAAPTPAPAPAPVVVAVRPKQEPLAAPSRKALSALVAQSKKNTAAPRRRPATPPAEAQEIVPTQTNVAVEPEEKPVRVQPSKRVSTTSTTPLAELQKRTSTPPPLKKSSSKKSVKAAADAKPPVPTQIEVVTTPEVNTDLFDDLFGILFDSNFDANLEMTFSQKNLNAQMEENEDIVSEITDPCPGPQETMKRKSLQTSRIRRDTLEGRNLNGSGITDPDAQPLRTSRIRRDTLCARNLDVSGIVDPAEEPQKPVKPLRTSRIRRDTLCARNLDGSGIVDPDAEERPSRAVEKQAPSLPQTSHNSMAAVTSPPTITKMLSPNSKKKPSLGRTSETASRLAATDPSLAMEASKEIQVPARPNLGRRSSSKKSRKPQVTSVTPTIHNNNNDPEKKKFPIQKQRSKKRISLNCSAFVFDQPAATTATTTTSTFCPPRTTSVEV